MDKIDLTTLGAVGDLPPTDHPIYEGPLRQASDIPSLDINPEQMALKLETLTARMGNLEAKAWTPTLTLVQVKPNTTRLFLLSLLLMLLAMRVAKSLAK